MLHWKIPFGWPSWERIGHQARGPYRHRPGGCSTPELYRALRVKPADVRDETVILNDRGDLPERLLDTGDGRVAAMDEAGVDVQVLSLAPPGTQSLPTEEAITLSRQANNRAADAVRPHPTRFRALTTLPMSDPATAVGEVERSATLPGHVGIMSYGRSGGRPPDDPANDDVLALAAQLRRPVFLHPQVPPPAVREASHRGLDPAVELGLSTYGWGWHVEAGTAALRLILRGTFDRHPGLQLVLGHLGELLLHAVERADGLSRGLDRVVAQVLRENVHITTSGMLTPRLPRHTLELTTVDRILLSGDDPFHRLDPAGTAAFLDLLPERADQEKIAHANAEALFGIEETQP